MRENRTYGSEGGEDLVLPDPYQIACGSGFSREYQRSNQCSQQRT